MTAAPDKRWTILEVLKWTTERFEREGVESARLDAEVLLADQLGIERIRLYTDFDKPLAQAELARFRQAIRRRLAGEPVAYITGRREFWSLTFEVSPAVLVPRPETEQLVERAVTWLKQASGTPIVVDVGTGSGAIAVAVAHEVPAAEVYAVDVEAAAVEVAQRNIERHGVAVTCLASDLLAEARLPKRFHAVLANLPYVDMAKRGRLEPAVAKWEPRSALDGGAQGMAVFERLIPQASRKLVEGGQILLETDFDQAPKLLPLLHQHGFVESQVHPDFAGHPRIVQATFSGA